MGRSLLIATLGVAAAAASTSTSVSTLSTTDEEQEQHRQLNWDGDGYYPWNDDGGWDSGKSGKSGSSSSSGHGSWSPWSGGNNHWDGPPSWSSGKSGKSGSSSSGGWNNVWNGGWGQPGWWGHSDGKSGKSGSSSGGGWGGHGGWNAGKSGKSGSSSSWGHGPWWGGQAWPSWGGWGGKSSKSKSSKSKSSKKGGHWVWVGPTWGNNWGWGHGKSGKSGSSGGWGNWGHGGWGGWGDWSSGKSDDDSWGGSSSSKPDYKPDYKPESKPVSSPTHPTGWKDDGWDNDEYYKVDLADIRAECNKLIEDSERELLPKMLRLVFHSCTGPDGCNGCVNMDNGDNRGLIEPMEGIYPLVQKYKGKLSRADVWAVCAVEAASMATMDNRKFALHYIGRHDCSDADEIGSGGSNPDMCSVDMTHSEMMTFFKDNFGMTDPKMIVATMAVHSASVASRDNSGFGHPGQEVGWVENAKDYVLSNAYFKSMKDEIWEIEKVENVHPVPNRHQWYFDPQHEGPIMTTADMALLYDFDGYIEKDKDGDNGAVTCLTHPTAEFELTGFENKEIPLCPFAEETKEWVDYFYDDDNQDELYDDFEKGLNIILNWGYQ